MKTKGNPTNDIIQKEECGMNISLNLTDALIIGLIVVTIILVIYLIVLAAKAKETLR